MFVRPTALATMTDAMSGWAPDLSLPTGPSFTMGPMPVRLTLVPPPPPRWTRRLATTVWRALDDGARAVVPERRAVADVVQDLAERLAATGGVRGDVSFDVAAALMLAASHLRGEYAADRRAHVAFLLAGSFGVVGPLDLVPTAITDWTFRRLPLVGFLAESIRGDIDLYRDWLRWEDEDQALPISLTEAFERWAALHGAAVEAVSPAPR